MRSDRSTSGIPTSLEDTSLLSIANWRRTARYSQRREGFSFPGSAWERPGWQALPAD